MASSTASTSKVLRQPDRASTALVLGEQPRPQLTDAELVIRTRAVALCNGELLWPLYDAHIFQHELIPGYDLSGVVVEAPEGCSFKVGDEVLGNTAFTRPGNARDYTTALESELALKPEGMSWEDAASLPISVSTAWQALFDQAGLPATAGGASGKRVLITAASGSVGIFLVQLAKWAGASVVASCGTQNVEMVKKLGAAEVVDYRGQGLDAWVGEDARRKVDVVIDCTGKETLAQAWSCVKDGGSVISIVSPPLDSRPPDCKASDVKEKFFIVTQDGKKLSELAQMVVDGKLVTRVDSVWAFDDYEKAFEKLGSGKANGKVILSMEIR